jgi:hypothetical protein
MNTLLIAATIAAIGVVLSWAGALFIAGSRWGVMTTRLERVEKDIDNMATRDQLASVKEDLAELKGMLRPAIRITPDG